jgi:EpsI family protein
MTAIAPLPIAGLPWRSAWWLLAILVCASALGWRLTPRAHMAQLNQGLVLETEIARNFFDWQLDASAANAVIDPTQQNLLKTLYTQNLSRTYVNSHGDRIMLSISYGANQAGDLELHRPEVCYAAQGFSMQSKGSSSISLLNQNKTIVLEHLWAQQRGRSEPISYWMRVGDHLMVSGLRQQFARIEQGLKGWVPDGVLFRVSSLRADPQAAYAIQAQFIQDLLASLSPRARRFLVGPVTSSL